MRHKSPTVITIGLYGTEKPGTWRERFIETYEALGITYFDSRSSASHVVDTTHFTEDEILIFAITGESYDTESLIEMCFGVVQATIPPSRQNVVVYISERLGPELYTEPVAAEESLRGRRLAKIHLANLSRTNMFLVHSLDEVLALSIRLHKAISETPK